MDPVGTLATLYLGTPVFPSGVEAQYWSSLTQYQSLGGGQRREGSRAEVATARTQIPDS